MGRSLWANNPWSTAPACKESATAFVERSPPTSDTRKKAAILHDNLHAI
uniref:Uncharacterized protein n=1 Tax=Rhodococcus hoagii TaxID=43767 RepID=A0A1Z1UWW3_RHOHA|nr:hypothetical protein pVAPN1354_0741 [Prescottella equi]ARX59970.1 hypothetical protein pVAPN1557_0741 [Prescottella equi]ARX60113.1 hypothetical protein pVAPN1572_0741 [Prescottella equi]